MSVLKNVGIILKSLECVFSPTSEGLNDDKIK